jgi:glycosyltransferase involved in cell wall biosynthesis
MLVSVIVPTHNRAYCLSRALDSVLRQSHQDLELIVVDDGSTDETPRLKDAYLRDSRVKWLEIPRGEYIAFLDSDDEWLPDKLSFQLQLTKQECRLWCHTEEIWIRNGQRVNAKKIHQKSGGWQFLKSLRLCCISPSTVMIHRSLWNKFPEGFREDFPVCEDYDLWLKYSLMHPISFVTEPMIKKYGGHADQLSRSEKAMDHYRALSLWNLREATPLHPDLKSEVDKELWRKLVILEKGYQKHQRGDRLSEILIWKNALSVS